MTSKIPLLAQLLLDAMDCGSALANKDGEIIAINAEFTALTGYALSDLSLAKQNLDTNNIFSFGLNDTAMIQKMQEAILTNNQWQGNIFRRHAKGKLVLLHHRLMPLHINTEQQISHILLTIKEAKETTKHPNNKITVLPGDQEYQNTLLREVHHRIKNNLQAVTGLIENIAIKHPQLNTPLNELISQLQSVSSMHNLQALDSKVGVDLLALIKSISYNNQLFWSTPININYPDQVFSIRLSESNSMPISLILNELFNNAAKHSKPVREVNCDLSVATDLNEITIQIKNPAMPTTENKVTPNLLSGQGKSIVLAMLPKDARLDWEQKHNSFIARLTLRPPMVSIEHIQFK